MPHDFGGQAVRVYGAARAERPASGPEIAGNPDDVSGTDALEPVGAPVIAPDASGFVRHGHRTVRFSRRSEDDAPKLEPHIPPIGFPGEDLPNFAGCAQNGNIGTKSSCRAAKRQEKEKTETDSRFHRKNYNIKPR